MEGLHCAGRYTSGRDNERAGDAAAGGTTTVIASDRNYLHPHDAVDVHMHTLASDGGWTPEQLVEHLVSRNFRVVAVCDHDNMRSVPETIERGEAHGITVVPGVEVTAEWDKRQWHILVYNVDLSLPRSARFRQVLKEQDDNLRAAAERAIELVENRGHTLTSLKEVVAGRPLLPVHVLQTLIKDGNATNLMTAHRLVIDAGETLKVDSPLDLVVASAKEAGGVCIVAHPGRDDGGGLMREEQLDRMLEIAAIDGLEGHYRSYSDDDTLKYRSMAIERNLVVSCGSDSHAPGHPVNPKAHPARWVAPFLRRLGFTVEPFRGASWKPGAPDVEELAKQEPEVASQEPIAAGVEAVRSGE
jgi:3',5'-nucleoside bisphosphate phosphatase